MTWSPEFRLEADRPGRQLGGMLGAIAGDIIGSVHELSRNEDAGFPLFAEKSCPTDDSLLTWAVAETIL